MSTIIQTKITPIVTGTHPNTTHGILSISFSVFFFLSFLSFLSLMCTLLLAVAGSQGALAEANGDGGLHHFDDRRHHFDAGDQPYPRRPESLQHACNDTRWAH